MKITVTESMFLDMFLDSGYANSFSLDGLRAIFEHLCSMETDDNQIELDVPSIDYAYHEYEDLDQANDDYRLVDRFDYLDECGELDEEAYHAELVREFTDVTTIMELDDSVIVEIF